MIGPRRSASGVTERPHCRGTRPPEGELRSVRRRIPTRPARPAVPALGFGMPSLGSRPMARGGGSRPRWPPEMSQLEKVGHSRTTGRWPKSAPKKQRQPDAFTLHDLRVWRVEALDPIPNSVVTTPRSAACLAGFLRLGCCYLASISGDGSSADRASIESMGRDCQFRTSAVAAPLIQARSKKKAISMLVISSPRRSHACKADYPALPPRSCNRVAGWSAQA